MRAIVTLAIGDEYKRTFERFCQLNWQAYADRIGCELIVFSSALDTSPRASSRSPSWQKCLILEQETVKNFEQIAWIDSDIVIGPRAPSIFDTVPVDHIGGVSAYDSPDPHTYRRWLKEGSTFLDDSTPEKYYLNRKVPPHDRVVQCGVFVCSPTHHRGILARAYQYEQIGDGRYHHEMAPLSHEMISSAPIVWLDPRFNAAALMTMHDGFPGRIEKALARLPLGRRYAVALHSRLGQSALRRAFLRRLIDANYFTHFAGAQHLISLSN